jgi:hypothetical protein
MNAMRALTSVLVAGALVVASACSGGAKTQDSSTCADDAGGCPDAGACAVGLACGAGSQCISLDPKIFGSTLLCDSTGHYALVQCTPGDQRIVACYACNCQQAGTWQCTEQPCADAGASDATGD